MNTVRGSEDERLISGLSALKVVSHEFTKYPCCMLCVCLCVRSSHLENMDRRLCPGVQQYSSSNLHWSEADLHCLQHFLSTHTPPPPPPPPPLLWPCTGAGVNSGKIIEEGVA